MSTALVSSFRDFGDVIYKPSSKIISPRSPFSLDREIVNTGVTLSLPRRILPSLQLTSTTPTKPVSIQNNTTSMTVSNTSTVNVASGGSTTTTREHRKLDRSFSEPVERNTTQQPRPSQANSSRYKTELCRPFEENGTCKYGDKCQFAHGIHELRTLVRHPKYKTELCRTFHSTGFCPYGPRCHFIHNSEETKKSLLTTLQAGLIRGEPTPQVTPVSRPKDLIIGNFSVNSAVDLSPPSSLNVSPTSHSGFFVDESYNIPFSPAPHTAPPTSSSFFFGNECSPVLTTVKPKVSQQQCVLPTISSSTSVPFHSSSASEKEAPRETVLKFTPLDTTVPIVPPTDSISQDMDRLTIEAQPADNSSVIDPNRGLRLPIFSRFTK